MTRLARPAGDVAVLVPAAGAGVRLGPGVPKALRPLRGEPVLVHAVRRLKACAVVGCVVVASPPGREAAVRGLLGPSVTVVPGGAERRDSVAAALSAVPPGFDIILVHDAARALVPPSLVDEVAAAVRAGQDAVIPVLPVVDTITRVAASGLVLDSPARSSLRAVQTPQGFRRTVLIRAHAAAATGPSTGDGTVAGPGIDIEPITDDAGLVARLGVPVHTVPGSEQAMKITRPQDFALAELFLDAAPAPVEEPR